MIIIPSFDTGYRSQHRPSAPTIRFGKFWLNEAVAKLVLEALCEPSFLTTLHHTGYVCYAVRNTLRDLGRLDADGWDVAKAFRRAVTREALSGGDTQTVAGFFLRAHRTPLDQQEQDALRIAWCAHIRDSLKKAFGVQVVQQPEKQDNIPQQTTEEEQPCQVTLGMLMQNPNTP